MATAEHDLIKPGDSDPSGNGKGETVVDASTSTFQGQLISIAAASVLVLGVVWASLKWGYHTEGQHVKEQHIELDVPPSFYLPLWGVTFVGTVLAFWAYIKRAFVETFGNENQKAESSHRFKHPPEWLLQLLVYALTGVVVFALIRLVSLTGGFTGSPFTPLMTAPAAVGAFMAFSKNTTIQLTAVGIASVWLSSEFLSHSSPHVVDPKLWVGVPKEALKDPIPLAASSWVFSLMATAMLIIAGGLSYYRHTRVPRGGSEQAKLSQIAHRWRRGRSDGRQ